MLAKCPEFPDATCCEHASAAPVITVRKATRSAASSVPIGRRHPLENRRIRFASLHTGKALLLLTAATIHDSVDPTLMQIKCG
jgi:hypothetical protein